jgi:threonine/homoserine/homoserine lactone efflux protein
MFETSSLLAFCTASALIILAPGPAQALVIARSVSDGKAGGILTAVGLNVGTLVHAVAAGLGLSVVLAASAFAFGFVKYVGAAYLVYLGVKAILSGKSTSSKVDDQSRQASKNVLGKAVATGILNPKIALFFLAFLPQFVDPTRGSVLLQFVALGSILATMDIVYESVLAVVASKLGDRFLNSSGGRVWRERLMGTVMIGLGLRLALSER